MLLREREIRQLFQLPFSIDFFFSHSFFFFGFINSIYICLFSSLCRHFKIRRVQSCLTPGVLPEQAPAPHVSLPKSRCDPTPVSEPGVLQSVSAHMSHGSSHSARPLESSPPPAPPLAVDGISIQPTRQAALESLSAPPLAQLLNLVSLLTVLTPASLSPLPLFSASLCSPGSLPGPPKCFPAPSLSNSDPFLCCCQGYIFNVILSEILFKISPLPTGSRYGSQNLYGHQGGRGII